MSFILNDIASYLTDLGLVSPSYPIYQGYIPDDQDQMMAVFETGGMPPTELGIGTDPRPNERVTFQFRVRGSRLNYAVTRAQWLACFNALQDSVLANPDVYAYIQAKHYGPIVFNDDRGRSNFISNFNCMKRNEA
jgi:hypothetical protein